MADAVALAKGFKAAQAGYSYGYQYDANGNLTFDESKQATIHYNHLNLPWKAVNSEGEVKWVYDANGTKLQKTVDSASGSSTVTYLDGIEKHSGGNVFVYHPEGRWAQYADDPYYPAWRLEYSLRDHLGNNRVMISDLNGDGYIQLSASDWVGNIPYIAPEIIQEEQYYPFGMAMEGAKYLPYWAKKDNYLFNGIERVVDLEINWYMSYCRGYEPSIARWVQADPLSELAPGWTPYRFGFNNPILFADPLGLFETRKQAKHYAKDNGIKTGFFGENKINKNKDADGNVSFSIDEKNGSRSITQDSELGIIESNVRVTEEAVGTVAQVSNSFWNLMRAGDSWLQSSSGQSFVQNMADLNPLVSGANAYYGFSEGVNIYEQRALLHEKNG